MELESMGEWLNALAMKSELKLMKDGRTHLEGGVNKWFKNL